MTEERSSRDAPWSNTDSETRIYTIPTLILLTDFFPRLLLKGSFCRDFVQFHEFCSCYRFKANLEVGHKCVNAIRITSPKIPSPINICVSFPNYKTVIKFGKQNNLCLSLSAESVPSSRKHPNKVIPLREDDHQIIKWGKST